MINKIHPKASTLTDWLDEYGVPNDRIEGTYEIPFLEFTENRMEYVEQDCMWTGLTTGMKRCIQANDIQSAPFIIKYHSGHKKFLVVLHRMGYCTDIFKHPYNAGSIQVDILKIQ